MKLWVAHNVNEKHHSWNTNKISLLVQLYLIIYQFLHVFLGPAFDTGEALCHHAWSMLPGVGRKSLVFTKAKSPGEMAKYPGPLCHTWQKDLPNLRIVQIRNSYEILVVFSVRFITMRKKQKHFSNTQGQSKKMICKNNLTDDTKLVCKLDEIMMCWVQTSKACSQETANENSFCMSYYQIFWLNYRKLINIVLAIV